MVFLTFFFCVGKEGRKILEYAYSVRYYDVVASLVMCLVVKMIGELSGE